MSVAFVACEDEILSVSFDQNYDEDVTIEKAIVTDTGEPVSIDIPAINTNSEEFAAQNTALDKIESATLNSATLTILSPDGQTWSFVNRAEIYAAGNGIDEQLIASISDIDETTKVLELDVQGVDLVALVKSGELSLRASITTDELVDEDVEVNAAVSLKVKAAAL